MAEAAFESSFLAHLHFTAEGRLKPKPCLNSPSCRMRDCGPLLRLKRGKGPGPEEWNGAQSCPEVTAPGSCSYSQALPLQHKPLTPLPSPVATAWRPMLTRSSLGLGCRPPQLPEQKSVRKKKKPSILLSYTQLGCKHDTMTSFPGHPPPPPMCTLGRDCPVCDEMGWRAKGNGGWGGGPGSIRKAWDPVGARSRRGQQHRTPLLSICLFPLPSWGFWRYSLASCSYFSRPRLTSLQVSLSPALGSPSLPETPKAAEDGVQPP